MTQVDVALTDYALAAECAVFTYWLARTRAGASEFRLWFVLFFSSISLATVAGGTVHGFFADKSSVGHRILWPATLILIGLAALCGMRVAALMELTGAAARIVNRAALAGFVIYVAVVLWISSAFLVAIIGYFPAMVMLGVSSLTVYRREGEPGFLSGFLGICVTFIAAGVQQMKVDISPRYFNHNSLYHVLQGIGLFMIFVMACAICRNKRMSQAVRDIAERAIDPEPQVRT